MERIVIHPFGIETTRFGFGCSSLLGLRSARESSALIAAAYDAGIRHFDVARSYGHGEAEGLLAKALGGQRAQVTITSKFGIAAQPESTVKRMVRMIARPVWTQVAKFRSRQKLGSARRTETLAFTAELARQSLETTLREMRSDYVDLFLLHEATADRLDDPELLRFLEDAVQKGTIRGYGIGSERRAIADLIRDRRAYCPVVQHESSLLIADVPLPESSFRVCHGALLRSLNTIDAATQNDQALARSMSERVGLDLTQRANLAPLLLRGAALQHPAAIILFSARDVRRIHQNVASLHDARLDIASSRLAEFLFTHNTQFAPR